MQSSFTITTSKKQELVDISKEVEKIVKESKVKEGICFIYVQHTTAAIIINENYDPNICDDVLEALNNLIPEGKWKHDRVDNNAAAHIKASIVGPSEIIPIKNGRLCLGNWQSPMLMELDGPRSDRKVIVEILS